MLIYTITYYSFLHSVYVDKANCCVNKARSEYIQ